MSQFLPYYVGRHIAADLDRQGHRPGLVLRVLAGIAALAALGMVACAALAIVLAMLWAAGITS